MRLTKRAEERRIEASHTGRLYYAPLLNGPSRKLDYAASDHYGLASKRCGSVKQALLSSGLLPTCYCFVSHCRFSEDRQTVFYWQNSFVESEKPPAKPIFY